MFLKEDECNKCIITSNATIKDAIEVLEKGKIKVVLVLDSNKILKGTIYDGDIRRALLKGLDLSANVCKAMVKSFIRVSENSSYKEIISIMNQNCISHLPVIGENNKFLGLHVLEDSGFKKDLIKLPNSVLLMAGGRGKRLMPLTENCPKPLLKINGKPLLEIILKQFIDAGIEKFYFSVCYLSEQIIDYFGDGEKWGVKISYIHEDKPLGTAGALTLLPKDISDPLLIMNGDILTKININHFINFHINNRADVSLSGSEYSYKSPYGVIDVDGVNFKSIIEKPTFKHYINAGIYIINPSILKKIVINEYLDMPDLLNMILKDQHKIVVYPIYEYWLDIGKLDNLNKAKMEWD